MPIPIVNVCMVVLRNSLAPINRFLTWKFATGYEYQKRLGFILFSDFGKFCYTAERRMNIIINSKTGDEEDKKDDEILNSESKSVDNDMEVECLGSPDSQPWECDLEDIDDADRKRELSCDREGEEPARKRARNDSNSSHPKSKHN